MAGGDVRIRGRVYELGSASQVLIKGAEGVRHGFPWVMRISKQQPLRDVAATALQALSSSSIDDVRQFLAPYRWFTAADT